MKIEKGISQETVNKLYRVTKNQRLLDEFFNGDEQVVRLHPEPGEYNSLVSAQSTLISAAKRLGYSHSIKVKLMEGGLYLIRIIP